MITQEIHGYSPKIMNHDLSCTYCSQTPGFNIYCMKQEVVEEVLKKLLHNNTYITDSKTE